MQRFGLAVLRRGGAAADAAADPLAAPAGTGAAAPDEDPLEWSWPPYAPVQSDEEPFDTPDWAPSSVVWHPAVRLGRWTVVYRRCA